MAQPVIAIGLDAGDSLVIQKLLQDGKLPNLEKLRNSGSYGDLENCDIYRAETPWTTVLTGCSPPTTGYWGPAKLDAASYTVKAIQAYDYRDCPPFYALGNTSKHRVAIFDVPQVRLSDQVNGIQVLGWGAHSQQTPSYSYPPDLLDSVRRKYKEHPAFGNDHANIYDQRQVNQLIKELQQGITRRTQICKDLLQQEDWDLFLTVFSETHSIGHSHRLSAQSYASSQGDIPVNNDLVTIYQAIDQGIGEIMDAAPKNASIIVFSGHGMRAYYNPDLTSNFFLPESLYRWNFPGQVGFADSTSQSEIKELSNKQKSQRGYRCLWSQKHDSNPLRQWLRAVTPTKLHRIYASLLDKRGITHSEDFVSPYTMQNRSMGFDWQPASWYSPAWSRMKAYALPSFSEGCIRINLAGRDPKGIVTAENYEAVCNEVIAHVEKLRDARTGAPLVERIVRTRTLETLYDADLPDADIIILWDESQFIDCVENPDIGRIGPVPIQHSGSHTSNGFIMAKGERIEAGPSLPKGHSLDLAPTILSLMGLEPSTHLEGKNLLPVKALASLS